MAVYFLFEFNKGVAAGLDVIVLLEQINIASSMYVAKFVSIINQKEKSKAVFIHMERQQYIFTGLPQDCVSSPVFCHRELFYLDISQKLYRPTILKIRVNEQDVSYTLDALIKHV